MMIDSFSKFTKNNAFTIANVHNTPPNKAIHKKSIISFVVSSLICLFICLYQENMKLLMIINGIRCNINTTKLVSRLYNLGIKNTPSNHQSIAANNIANIHIDLVRLFVFMKVISC
jgi:hypothetical protein